MSKNPYYSMGRALIWMYAGLMFKLKIKRHVELPCEPAIFVANHPSATDPFLIHFASHQPLRVLITVSAFRTPILGWYLHKIRQIPVLAEQGSAALDHACQAIHSGHSVGIFIEGAISPQGGGFHPPRTGAARLALMTGAPIIPVGIYLRRQWNYRITSRISGNHTEGFWYLSGPYAMTVGQPMQLGGDVQDREHVRHVTEHIMGRIRDLALESERQVRPLQLGYSPA